MDRRSFIRGAGALSAAGILEGLDARQRPAAAEGLQVDDTVPGPQPNIVFILVDQLRFPSVFPHGIDTPDAFLKQFMPHLHALWVSGVKFANHYTAGVACTPSRGCLITGLYTQQSWLMSTITVPPSQPYSLQPTLSTVYPTYGKLLQAAGYQTPYSGKWHVSVIRQDGVKLKPYGFDSLVYPDPTGSNLQGTYGDETNGYRNDGDIAQAAVDWLGKHGATSPKPWCLTVSFVNPHDKEFFWAGTEFQTYNNLFPTDGKYRPFTPYSTAGHPPIVDWNTNQLKTPPELAYPELPPNWESPAQLAANKPSTHTFARVFSGAVWGEVDARRGRAEFSVEPYPPSANSPDAKPYGIGTAPFSYWKRNLESYTQIMNVVDQQIGAVLEAVRELPPRVRRNTVIVFTSDHGEYAGAHGIVAGKVGTSYNEAYHVPLIVFDPSGRFTADIEQVRYGLTSSVDVFPMLVGLGNLGHGSWLRGDYRAMYGRRHDLLAMLQSSEDPGRRYVLTATDEVPPANFNFNNSPGHVVALRTQDFKLGTYANWIGTTSQIDRINGFETEFYDYATPRGRAELDNDPSDERATALVELLLKRLIPNEMQEPLPGVYGVAQRVKKAEYLAYHALVDGLTAADFDAGQLSNLIGYGKDF